MILPRGLFHGIRNYEEIHNYIGAQLRDIIADERTHRQLVADPDFSFHLLFPTPASAAIATMARSQGWCAESLAGVLASNIAFLEHAATRIKDRPEAIHICSAAIPVFVAAASSARKSSLISYSTQDLLQSCPSAPEQGHLYGRCHRQRLASMPRPAPAMLCDQ